MGQGRLGLGVASIHWGPGPWFGLPEASDLVAALLALPLPQPWPEQKRSKAEQQQARELERTRARVFQEVDREVKRRQEAAARHSRRPVTLGGSDDDALADKLRDFHTRHAAMNRDMADNILRNHVCLRCAPTPGPGRCEAPVMVAMLRCH